MDGEGKEERGQEMGKEKEQSARKMERVEDEGRAREKKERMKRGGEGIGREED